LAFPRSDFQTRQPLQRRRVTRIGGDQSLQVGPFRLGIAPSGGKPGAEGQDLLAGEAVGRQVRRGTCGLLDPVGRACPVQPGPPDRKVIRPAPKAGIEPPRRFFESPCHGRQVGSSKPDTVVVRGLLGGPFQLGLDALDPGGPGIEQPEVLEQGCASAHAIPACIKQATKLARSELPLIEVG
jgi:hypothetical protein